MNLQEFFTSARGTGLSMSLGRRLPRRVGWALVKALVPIIARRRDSTLVRAIRLNQSVARDLPFDAPELDQAVRQVLFNAGTGYYELYHRLALGQQAVMEAVDFLPGLDERIQQAAARGQGVLIVGPHIGNFDLGLMVFAARQYPIQVISYTLPPGGYELQNKIRADAGYIITPASQQAARMALERLKRGGIVVTGIDRPLPGATRPLQFFGRPALLPTGHIRMALSTGAMLVLLRMEPDGDGTYQVTISDPVDLVDTGDRHKDTERNAEHVLTMVEAIIRAHPAEWMMFHPVWPQLLS